MINSGDALAVSAQFGHGIVNGNYARPVRSDLRTVNAVDCEC